MSTFLYFFTYFFGCFGLSAYLFEKYLFFRKKRGFISVFFIAFIAVILHNFLDAWLFPEINREEPVFLFMAIIGIGMSFFLFVLWLARGLWYRIKRLFGKVSKKPHIATAKYHSFQKQPIIQRAKVAVTKKKKAKRKH